MRIIESKEDVLIKVLLEKGDKIKVLDENSGLIHLSRLLKSALIALNGNNLVNAKAAIQDAIETVEKVEL